MSKANIDEALETAQRLLDGDEDYCNLHRARNMAQAVVDLKSRLTPRPMDEAPTDGTPVLIQLGEYGDPTAWKWSVMCCEGVGKVWTLHCWYSGEALEDYCNGWLPCPPE